MESQKEKSEKISKSGFNQIGRSKNMKTHNNECLVNPLGIRKGKGAQTITLY